MNELSKIISSREAEKTQESIDKIRYEIEDFFDNAERRGDKYTLSDGRILADKVGDMAASFHSQSLLLLLQGITQETNQIEYADIGSQFETTEYQQAAEISMERTKLRIQALLTEAISNLGQKQ